jgi:hypothetical protein
VSSDINMKDPYLLLASLPELHGLKKRVMPAPVTATAFPFQEEQGVSQGRWSAVELLWTRVFLPNWQAFRGHHTEDKKAWISAFVHGFSGVGKTRFLLEFLNLLRQYLQQRQFDKDAEVLELREWLCSSRMVLLDLRHGGNALSEEEMAWPASTILGLRVAAKYWFPQVPYQKIRDMIMDRADKASGILRLFSLSAVLASISRHPPTTTASSIPKVLFIAVDEIQTAFELSVLSQGRLTKSPRGPLSAALNRALMGAISITQELFVMGAFGGTARRHPMELLDPTDFKSYSVLLQPLVPEAVTTIVRSFKKKDELGNIKWTGQDWLDLGEPVKRLLRALGGSSRALECLEKVLHTYSAVPTTLPLDGIVGRITPLLAETYSLESWGKHGSGFFGLFLALAGVPLDRDQLISGPDAPEIVSVRDLERAGLVQVRPPPVRPSVWGTVWGVTSNNTVVLEVPLLLALAALENAEVPAQFATAAHEARDLLRHFYYNPTTFEQALVRHGVLRYNVASQWATLQGRSTVPAKDLLCGAVCSPAFAALKFKPAEVELIETSTSGIWCKTAFDRKVPVPEHIQLQDHSLLPLSRQKPFGLHLGGQNILDGVQAACLAAGSPALLWLDTKHGELETKDTIDPEEVRDLVRKLEALRQRLLPQYVHLLRVATTKRAASAANVAMESNGVCLISNTDDGLAWSVGPTLAYLFANE